MCADVGLTCCCPSCAQVLSTTTPREASRALHSASRAQGSSPLREQQHQPTACVSDACGSRHLCSLGLDLLPCWQLHACACVHAINFSAARQSLLLSVSVQERQLITIVLHSRLSSVHVMLVDALVLLLLPLQSRTVALVKSPHVGQATAGGALSGRTAVLQPTTSHAIRAQRG